MYFRMLLVLVPTIYINLRNLSVGKYFNSLIKMSQKSWLIAQFSCFTAPLHLHCSHVLDLSMLLIIDDSEDGRSSHENYEVRTKHPVKK